MASKMRLPKPRLLLLDGVIKLIAAANKAMVSAISRVLIQQSLMGALGYRFSQSLVAMSRQVTRCSRWSKCSGTSKDRGESKLMFAERIALGHFEFLLGALPIASRRAPVAAFIIVAFSRSFRGSSPGGEGLKPSCRIK